MSNIDVVTITVDGQDDGQPRTRGIWNSWEDNNGGETSDSIAARLPAYEPKFDDSIEKHITIDVNSKDYKSFFAHESKILADLISLGTIKFDIELERVKVDHDDHKDLIVHVACHRDGLDPIWRCTFQCEVDVSFGDVNAKATGLKKDARNKDNILIMPVMRLPAEPVREASIFVRIKMSKWKGIYPRLVHDFTKQTQFTNATLIVEESPLYVTREILAMHSAYFNTMFFNDNFADAAKTEYNFPDVSYADMMLLLNLSYPETMVGRREKYITSLDDIERMLQLSEQFTVPALKNLAERMLKGAPSEEAFPNASWTRILYIADRFRLSEACSAQMRRLRTEADFVRLRQSDEFELLSARLRSSLLTTALEKLPPTTKTRKKTLPSRTGRIGILSDVEVDDDEDDGDDIAVISVNSIPRPVTLPSTTTNTARIPAQDPRRFHAHSSVTVNSNSNATQSLRPIAIQIPSSLANTSSNAPQDPRRPVAAPTTTANTSNTATQNAVTIRRVHFAPRPQPAPSSSSVAAAASAVLVPPSTVPLAAAALPTAPERPSLTGRSPGYALPSGYGGEKSPGYGGERSPGPPQDRRTASQLSSSDSSPNSAMFDSDSDAAGPSRRQEKDIKAEVISSDEMERDDQPGPSTRPSKRSIKSGVTTRSRAKKTKKE